MVDTEVKKSRVYVSFDRTCFYYQMVIVSWNNFTKSSGLAGRGESLVTLCWGNVPATRSSISRTSKPTAFNPFGIPVFFITSITAPASTAANLPTGAIFDPQTGIFSWSPTYSQAGNYPNVLFTVTDNGYPAMSASESITISVGNVNRPPQLDAIGNKTIDENNMLQFTVTASDPDNDALTYAASNLPVGAVFDPQTQTFNWTPTFENTGNYTVYFTIRDNGDPSLIASESITISVKNANRPPRLQAIPAIGWSWRVGCLNLW